MFLQASTLPIQWQIFIASQAVLLIGGMIKLSVTLAELKLRIKVQENRTLDIERKEDKMNEKLDDILEQIGEMRVELSNKVNRN